MGILEEIIAAELYEDLAEDLYSISFDLEGRTDDSYGRIVRALKRRTDSVGRATQSQLIVRWPDTTAQDINKYLRSCQVNRKKLFVRGDKLNVIAIADFAGFDLPPEF